MDKEYIKKTVLQPILDHGYQAFFVGGCVRDKLMKMAPHDYDVVTSATPDQVHSIFTSFVDIKSEAFGITVVNVGGENVEIATMREDRECDGRHTDVTYTTDIATDAKRRDFTINALYEDINGVIYDPTGLGLQDIKDGVLRFVGNPIDRCQEDCLRLLRALRFWASKTSCPGKNIPFILSDKSEIIGLMQDNEFTKQFNKRVSPERIGNEMVKLISGFNAPNVMEFMCDWLLYDMKIFPKNFYKLREQEVHPAHSYKPKRPYSYFRSNMDHTLNVFQAMCNETSDLTCRLAALFHDIGKSTVQNPKTLAAIGHDVESVKLATVALNEYWKLPKHVWEPVIKLIAEHMNIGNMSKTKKTYKLWEFKETNDFQRLMKLFYCDSDDISPIDNGYRRMMLRPDYDWVIHHAYPLHFFTGSDLSQYVSPGEFFKDGLKNANQNVAISMIKAGTTSIELSPEQKERILRSAAQVVLDKRKSKQNPS